MTTLLVVSGIVAFGFIGGVIGRKLFGENCNKIIDYNSDEETIFNFRCTEVHVTDSNDLEEQLLPLEKNTLEKEIPKQIPKQINDYKLMNSSNRFKNDVY